MRVGIHKNDKTRLVDRQESTRESRALFEHKAGGSIADAVIAPTNSRTMNEAIQAHSNHTRPHSEFLDANCKNITTKVKAKANMLTAAMYASIFTFRFTDCPRNKFQIAALAAIPLQITKRAKTTYRRYLIIEAMIKIREKGVWGPLCGVWVS